MRKYMDLLIISAIFLICFLVILKKTCIIFEYLTQLIIFILLSGGEEESIL